ncbi:hypothetical protein BH10BAC6_BH10BAC6_06730 [soil metagenome]
MLLRLRVVFFLTMLGTTALYAQQELVQPKEVRSVDKVLTDTLTMKISPITFGTTTITSRLYNEGCPGPTWRIKAGDLMRVLVKNQLPPNPDQDSADEGNYPQKLNTTNLHVHGLNVSPKDSSDNILLSIPPGTNFQFHIQLPDDHACGTYWYHPHHHTSTYGQVISGLAGAIIIEDEEDTTLTDPKLLAIADRIFIFSTFTYDSAAKTLLHPPRLTSATAFSPFPGIETPILANGMEEAKVTFRPGEIQRWRLINATFELNADVRWLKIVGTDTTVMTHLEIANDGLYFPSALPVQHTLVPTGARADVLVTAPSEAGTYVMELVTKDRNLAVVARRMLITMVVAGDPIVPAMQMPTRLPRAVPEGTIKDSEITGTKSVVFNIGDLSNIGKDSSLVTRSFTINNAPFNHDVVNMTVQVGTAEEWTIQNTSTATHPFHIHVNEFQVTERNGVKLDPPVWHDVLLLDTMSTYKIRMRFVDYDGKTVMHCHYLPHEDWGMMNLIEILPASTSVNDRPWDAPPMAFPNPIVGRIDRISVRIPEFFTGRAMNISLCDITGKTVLTQRIESVATTLLPVDVSALSAGTYYLRVDDGNAFRETDMLVLVR